MNKEIEIPEGYEARIEGNKVIFEQKESDDERIRKVIRLALIASEDELSVFYKTHNITRKECTDWLEKQKIVPVQTEEERMYIRTLQSLISDFLRDHDNQTNTEFYQGCWDWLEGRHIEQKPAEWSEEDKGILLECISVLQNSSHWLLADKLKSLHPQSHWKPSEEQLSILGKVFAGCKLNTAEKDSMVDLFYNLKQMLWKQ